MNPACSFLFIWPETRFTYCAKSFLRLRDVFFYKWKKLKNEHFIEYLFFKCYNWKWIYASEDEFLTRRRNEIVAREKLVKTIQKGELNYKNIREILEYNKNVDNYNIEQLSARILFDLTRNTGFEVSKSNIGECWIKSCCEWEQRMPDDICGLDTSRLQHKEKMQHICKKTSLLKKFQNIGLEVILC